MCFVASAYLYACIAKDFVKIQVSLCYDACILGKDLLGRREGICTLLLTLKMWMFLFKKNEHFLII